MVYRNSRKRRSNRRRNPRRRYNKYRKRMILAHKPKNMPSYLVNYGPGNLVIPDRYFTKLKYFYGAAYTSASPSTSLDYIMRANSIFDPDFQVGGQRPTGAEELFFLYKSYVVLACKLKLTVINRSQFGLVCGIIPATSSTSIVAGVNANSYKLLATLPYGRVKICGAETGQDKVIMTNYMSTNKIYGDRPQAIIDSPDYYGLLGSTGTGSSPLQTWYWHNAIAPLEPTQALDFEYAIEMTFYVALDDRQRLSYST